MYKHSWTRSPEQRDIELYSNLNDLKKLKNPYLFIGGVHGDEPEGVYLAQSLLQWAQLHSQQIKADLLIIPCLNVDGYFKNQRTNSRGVDLNRNFPSENWSPEFKQERYHPGDHPSSEHEIQQLVNLIHVVQPKVIFHFHSWKPCVVVTGPTDLKEAQPLAESSGFEITSDIGYPTPGSLGDYGWNQLQTPVVCTEDSEHRDPIKPWLHFGEGLKKIISH